jgi:hypothetical protein
VIGSGALAGGLAAGCSSPSPHPSASTSTTDSDHSPPAWSKLAASLAGTLLLPSDDGYAAAGHLYNSVYATDAAAIAQCAQASDVQRCLAFAREHDVEVVARSGGHSYAGYSTCPGLVIDVSPLDGVTVDGGGQGPATVGAGAVLIDVYSSLAAQGRLLPGGSCPTVGIAGLALGGGIGVFSQRLRAHVRPDDLGRDRHRRRSGPALWSGARRGPVLGQPRRRRRELRCRDLVRFSDPPHSRRDHPLHAGVALGSCGGRSRRVVPVDPVGTRRVVGQLSTLQQWRSREWPH